MLNDLINQCKQNSSGRTNLKNEVDIMQAMLNDPNYKVNVYKKGQGVVGELSMYDTSRELVSNVLQNSANISKDEAKSLSENYNFDKKAAGNMVDISKEFMNTYLETGNKINLGPRENINASLCMKQVESKEKILPPGTLANKTDKPISKTMPAYNTVKVSGKNLY